MSTEQEDLESFHAASLRRLDQLHADAVRTEAHAYRDICVLVCRLLGTYPPKKIAEMTVAWWHCSLTGEFRIVVLGQ